jgi:hypothetical protein
MTFVTPPESDARRFLATYNEVAERSAANASRYGIEGRKVFEYAREWVAHEAATGKLECPGGRL